jgi:hypothetical protein
MHEGREQIMFVWRQESEEQEAADFFDDGTTARIEVDSEDISVIELALSRLVVELQGARAAERAEEILQVIRKGGNK